MKGIPCWTIINILLLYMAVKIRMIFDEHLRHARYHYIIFYATNILEHLILKSMIKTYSIHNHN